MTSTLSAEDDAPRRRGGSPAEVVAASGLPSELGALVLAVTGKCKLWKRERTEVARELCSHFREGLEAGATAQALAGAFGEPDRTAALITRSRKRLRPLWWRAARQSLRGTGVFFALLLLTYGVLAARFFWRSPNVSRNMVRELNAPVLASKTEERAWPLYIRARIEFGAMPDFMLNSDHPDPRRVGEPGWEQMTAWLDAHEGAMHTLRTAASKPVLGYVLRSTTDPELARAMELTTPNYKHDPSSEVESENPMLIGVLLPHLGEMRRFARWLASDANLALSRGDSERYLADIRALLGMAEQTRQGRFLISDLVGLAIANLTFSTVLETATAGPALTDRQLHDLAHEISAFAGGRFTLDMTSETMMVEDILQRFYSDDGNGDGYYIGGSRMDELYAEWGIPKPKAMTLLTAIQPVQSAVMPSRKQINERVRLFLDAAASDDALPPWRHAERKSDAAYAQMMNSGLYLAVPFLSSLMNGQDDSPMRRSFSDRDRVEGLRSAVLVALAIESYRREHGAWPADLAALVPSHLPRVPLDPFDGMPMRYKAPSTPDARPLIYSVGADGIDDGGLLTTTKDARGAVSRFPAPATTTGNPAPKPPTGDWILWPVPPEITDPAN